MTATLNDVPSVPLRDVFLTQSFGSAALGESTGTANEAKCGAFTYRINGVGYNKAADTDFAILPVATQAANTTQYWLIVIDSTGAITFLPPPAANAANPDTTGLLLAEQPANKAVIGIMKLVTTTAITFGTNDLAGAGTFVNLNTYPIDGDPTVFTYA
jgi:hypothetical protein